MASIKWSSILKTSLVQKRDRAYGDHDSRHTMVRNLITIVRLWVTPLLYEGIFVRRFIILTTYFFWLW